MDKDLFLKEDNEINQEIKEIRDFINLKRICFNDLSIGILNFLEFNNKQVLIFKPGEKVKIIDLLLNLHNAYKVDYTVIVVNINDAYVTNGKFIESLFFEH